MNRKHVYIAVAVALGALAAWWWKRSSKTPPRGDVEIDAGATVNGVAIDDLTAEGYLAAGHYGFDWS